MNDHPTAHDRKSEIRRLIAELSASSDPFDDGEDLFSRGVLRSMNLMELVDRLEDRYRIRVGHRDFVAGRLRSVEAITALVGGSPRP
jgi:acyl carrier protein